MKSKGFTLVELLVVMAILGILVTLIGGGFRTAQMRGRDAQRKSDLKEIANSLELFYADHNRYPSALNGAIEACPYDPETETGIACAWGTGEVTDGKTTYFKMLVNDPLSNQGYVYLYRIVPGSNNQQYQVFARVENEKDQDCIGGNCSNPVALLCAGSKACNFAVTSANTTATE